MFICATLKCSVTDIQVEKSYQVNRPSCGLEKPMQRLGNAFMLLVFMYFESTDQGNSIMMSVKNLQVAQWNFQQCKHKSLHTSIAERSTAQCSCYRV